MSSKVDNYEDKSLGWLTVFMVTELTGKELNEMERRPVGWGQIQKENVG